MRKGKSMQPKDLGLKIKNLRITKKLTQEEFADLLIIAPQTVSKWERGVSYPNIFYLQKMCKLLGVSILDFLEDESEGDNEDYYIAIDGGGTKTEFVLFKADGTVVATAMYGTTNPNSAGLENSCAILKEGLDNLLAFRKTPKRIFAGIAGAMVGNNKELIRSFLKKTYPSYKITVDSDIKNIIGLVRENEKCIAAIIGTGSVVYGCDGGTFKRVGGWGYLMDDAGSGYDIGREVLLAAYSYADGLTPISEVVRLAEIKLGGHVTENSDKIYGLGKSFIASFCPIAFEAMAVGDKLAEGIITKSAGRFAALINHTYRLGEYGNRVIISGGLAMHGMEMMKIIESLLDPGITVEFPELPPIFGAMRTCVELDRSGLQFEAFEENFKKSYHTEK